MSNSRSARRAAARARPRLLESAAALTPPATSAEAAPGLVPTTVEPQVTTPTTTPTTTPAETVTVAESVPGAIREAPTGSPMTVPIQIIQAGWNKAGTRFYPPEVLARDIPKVYPAGTHMYLDHPTTTEEHELPERSVTRLAAVLTEAPHTTDGGRTMRAQVRVFAPHREFIAEAWQDIGVSINGDGEGHYGERDGRNGLIIEALTAGRSIDFVTRAGAGGRILQLVESAHALREARNVGAWLESRLHRWFTELADDMYGDGRLTRDERITLSSAIGAGLTAFTGVLDEQAAHLYQRHPAVDPDPDSGQVTQAEVREAAPSDAASEPAPESGPEPAPGPELGPGDETTASMADPARPDADGTPPAAATTMEGVTPMSGDNTQTGTQPAPAGTTNTGPSPEVRAELAETRLREAEAKISELTTTNASLVAERDQARGELARLRVTEASRGAVGTALAATDLPEAARTRVTEAVTRDVPTTQDGQVDGAALTARISEAVDRERSYIASIREAAGEGRPNGLGGQPTGVPAVEPWRASLVESFKGLGMSEQAATAAANGR